MKILITWLIAVCYVGGLGLVLMFDNEVLNMVGGFIFLASLYLIIVREGV